MRLKLPTDRMILEGLTDGRNVAVNIAAEIDRHRNYVNQRLPELEDHGLVEKIGPAENTGLYELTAKGWVTLTLIDDYEPGDEFERRVEARAEDFSYSGPQFVEG